MFKLLVLKLCIISTISENRLANGNKANGISPEDFSSPPSKIVLNETVVESINAPDKLKAYPNNIAIRFPLTDLKQPDASTDYPPDDKEPQEGFGSNVDLRIASNNKKSVLPADLKATNSNATDSSNASDLLDDSSDTNNQTDSSSMYDGWHAVKIDGFHDFAIRNDNEETPEDILRSLEDRSDTVVLHEDRLQGFYHVAVAPGSIKELTKKFESKGLGVLVRDKSFGEEFALSKLVSTRSSIAPGDLSLTEFMQLYQIDDFTKKFATDNAAIVKRSVIGKSVEGHDIYMLTITSPFREEKYLSEKKYDDTDFNVFDAQDRASNLTLLDVLMGSESNSSTHDVSKLRFAGDGKPVIIIDGGVHAREWISPAALMYFATRLIEDQSLLKKFEWRLIPVLNPDGYKYSWTHNRLWRKNRSYNKNSKGETSRGVDLNRNYAYKYGVSGTSSRITSDVYKGPEAFSEPETRALRDVVLDVLPRLEAYVSVHAYGQYILHSWGYNGNATHPRRKEQEEMGGAMKDAIYKVHGKEFQVGGAGKMLYEAAGGSDDYVGSLCWPHDGPRRVTHSYTLELRDRGTSGFRLKADEIKPAVEETYAAMQALGHGIVPRADMD